jgi:hypothetical protein
MGPRRLSSASTDLIQPPALYYALGLARRQHSSVIAVYAMTTPAGYDAAMVAAPYQASLEVAEELKPKIQAMAAVYHASPGSCRWQVIR